MKKHTHPAYTLDQRAEIRLKISPGYRADSHKFAFGSCEGLFMLTPTAYVLVAVVNTRPGNGTFAKLLAHLHALAQQHHRDIVVSEIHNPRLAGHLAQRHGYTILAGTRNAFLSVAGPGVAPAEASQPAPPSPWDSLLDTLTALAQ